jgi:uncharacterized membrane protein
MKSIVKVFLTGVFTLIPILATIYLMVWLLAAVEAFLGKQLKLLIPDDYYRAGLGMLAAVVVIFAVGLLTRAWIFRQLLQWGEELLLKIPLVKVIYKSLKDLFGLFAEEHDDKALQVVSVTLPGTDMKLIGFVTRSDFTDLPPGVGDGNDVAVYLPMSYQVGGYTVVLPRSRITAIDMPRDEAMRFVLTAGLKSEGRQITATNRGKR